MQASDRIAAAAGMMIGISGLVLGIFMPPLAAIGGAVYAVNLAAGMTVGAKIGFGILGAIGGGVLGKGLSPVINFTSAMVAGIAVRVTYAAALGIEKIGRWLRKKPEGEKPRAVSGAMKAQKSSGNIFGRSLCRLFGSRAQKSQAEDVPKRDIPPPASLSARIQQAAML